MAQKRMFNLSVVDTDEFLEMPISSRLLYYELGLRADDDGFVSNWKKILTFTGLKEDDLKILISKSFIIPFETGVIVIRHWRLNNYLQKDRYKPTIYQEELNQLGLDNNNVYTLENSNVETLELTQKSKTNVNDARKKRIEAKKESNLPYSFEYKIRNAFIGKTCPICKREMNATSDKNKPTIQHNKPISLGGKHEIDNISVICSSCNCSIQNKVETPPYNTKEVKEMWECIGNVYNSEELCIHSIDKNSIDKIRLDKNSIDNIYEFVEKNFGRTLAPLEMELISTWEDNELTRYAIKQTVLNRVSNLKYTQSILNSYKAKGITSVLEAEKEDKKRNDKLNKEEPIPDWYGKEIDETLATPEEQQEMEDLLSEFK